MNGQRFRLVVALLALALVAFLVVYSWPTLWI